MINGVHALIYTPKAEELRRFLRDVLGFSGVEAGENLAFSDLRLLGRAGRSPGRRAVGLCRDAQSMLQRGAGPAD